MPLWWILINFCILYPIVRQDYWGNFKVGGLYFSDNFEKEGFIHLSKDSQGIRHIGAIL